MLTCITRTLPPYGSIRKLKGIDKLKLNMLSRIVWSRNSFCGTRENDCLPSGRMQDFGCVHSSW
jgi:hypothetical protein